MGYVLWMDGAQIHNRSFSPHVSIHAFHLPKHDLTYRFFPLVGPALSQKLGFPSLFPTITLGFALGLIFMP